jgi:hypothetical protein
MAENGKQDAVGTIAELGKRFFGGGKLGAAANDLTTRKSKIDAAVDAATGDSTSVEYGGQRGQADRSKYNTK